MQITATAASVVAALALGFTAGSYDPNQPAQDDSPATEHALPDMAELAAAMEAAGTPGEHHRLLDAFVGTWDCEVKYWVDPSLPPGVSTGRMVNEWILDGRHLRESYTGEMMGQPFSGMGLWSYDNAAKTYRGLWVDSSSTGWSSAAGFVDETGKRFTMFATDTDPMTGEAMNSEDIVEVLDENRTRMTRYMIVGDEKIKSMELNYTRVADAGRAR